MPNLRLYISTVLHLKPSQIVYRIWRRLGGRACLRVGYSPSPDSRRADISRIPVLSELDFDPAFLSRFNVDAILVNRIELLHHEEEVDWNSSWHEELSTPLWRFNLHYCEYLLPLVKTYLDTGDVRYLDKAKAIVESWIASCPCKRGSAAWNPYVISMRVVNWLAFYGEVREELDSDSSFVAAFNQSLAEQFAYLAQHLEKDLLANHYLENLKALVILSCYFDDEMTLGLVLPKLYEQVKEQILPDGMHFELSPMYHKIVLEDLLRVAACLVARGQGANKIAERLRLQDMCDCLWSMERNTNRTPLFNDSGDNVAKSRDALLACSERLFGHKPVASADLSASGYHIVERECPVGKVKLIFDVGMPGPRYAFGHAHCDALSFELFIDGAPVVVNSGTYAYQDPLRSWFRSSAAHNGVWCEGVEQSEMWGEHRMARGASARLLKRERKKDFEELSAKVVDHMKGKIVRTIRLTDDSLFVSDEVTEGNSSLCSVFRFPSKTGTDPYAPDFGQLLNADRIEMKSRSGSHTVVLSLKSRLLRWVSHEHSYYDEVLSRSK